MRLPIDRYDQKRLFHQNHSLALVNCALIKQGSHEELCMFIDTIEHNVSSMKDAKQYDLGTFLTSILSHKLSKKLQESWFSFSHEYKEVPDVSVLLRFLKEKMKITPVTLSSNANSDVKNDSPHHLKKHKNPVHAAQFAHGRNNCSLCRDQKHPLYLCPSFKSVTVEARSAHIKSSNSCFNCLGMGHRTRECRCTVKCKRCNRSHHTLLHREKVSNESNSVQSSVSSTGSPSSPLASMGTSAEATGTSVSMKHVKPHSSLQTSLSMTSQVILEAPSGKRIVARALLDSGAGLSLLSQHVVTQLQLPKTSRELSISGVMGTNAGSVSHMVYLVIAPKRAFQPRLSMEAVIVPKVTCDLPLEEAKHLKDLPHLRIRPSRPVFHMPGKIDILLGCNVYQDLLLSEFRKGSSDEPIARETIFGWAVIGQYTPDQSPVPLSSTAVFNVTSMPGEDAILQRFWEVEEVPSLLTELTNDEQVVVKHYHDTHVHSSGRYKVTLPRKPEAPQLGDSRIHALQRFHSNE